MHTDPGPPPGAKYETRDVSIGFFARVVLGLLALTLLGMSVSLWFFWRMEARHEAAQPPPPPLAQTLPRLPPEPRLQVTPGRDLERFHAEEAAALASYGWVDRNTGVVRIPIERAMDLLAERGLPVRPQPAK